VERKIGREDGRMNDTKWCWREGPHAEHAQGPFDTREEAVESARDDLSDRLPAKVLIGMCSYANATNYINYDLDDFLDHIEENAYDQDFSFWVGGEVFDVGDRQAAQVELAELLKSWAEKHLSSTVWCTGSEEEVVLRVANER
jgi:hypothetical protein